MRRSFGRISPERTLDIRPAHQLEVLRGGRVVAILRDEQPARISRAKIADGDLDPIGFLRAVHRAGVDAEAPDIIFIGELPDRIGIVALARRDEITAVRSEEHTSELKSLMRISYAVFCLKK